MSKEIDIFKSIHKARKGAVPFQVSHERSDEASAIAGVDDNIIEERKSIDEAIQRVVETVSDGTFVEEEEGEKENAPPQAHNDQQPSMQQDPTP